MGKPLLLFIAIILLAQTGFAQLTNTSKRTIVVMGSSSAFGWRATVPDSAYVNRLQNDLHFYNRGDTIINIAYPGNTTYICLPTGYTHPAYAPDSNPAQNVTAALSYNPTFVIISLPTNDIADGYSDSETLANYAVITAKLDSAKIPYIITGTQPRDLATDTACNANGCLSTGGLTPAQQADLGTFNTLLTAQYPSNSTYSTSIVNNFLTLLSVSSTNFEINPSLGYGDGIHYVDAGHRIVYNTFLDFQLYKDLVNFTQTISFSLSPKSLGTPDFDPGAAATSGLQVTYSSDNPAVATIVNNKIHLVGVGTANITASQSGNVHYLAASNVTVTLQCTSAAATTYDWLGGVSAAWNDPNNWQSTSGGVTSNPATDYPGDQQSTDQVNVGVNVNYTNNPEVTSTPPNIVSSITFGDRLITGGATATNTLTVDTLAILNVSGQILQKHTTAGVFNSGNTAAVTAVQTYLQGSGTINCGSISVGDSTTPTADSVINITQVTMGAVAGGSHIKMNVTGDLNISTQSRDNAGNTIVVSNNNAQFSLSQGVLTVGGRINLTDGGAANCNHAQFKPEALFSMDMHNNADSVTLNLQNANALTSQTGSVGNKFDFYNPVQAGGTGIATVNYTGNTNQEVYNYISGSGADAFVDHSGTANGDGLVYEYLGFSGSGTKTVDASSPTGTLIVGADVNLGAGTETVDLSTNNCALVMGANLITGAGSTLNCGSRPVIIGASFINSGNCNFKNAKVTFNSGGSEILATANPQSFTNVNFSGGGSLAMISGSFLLACNGVLTMSNNTKLDAGGNLTLSSDSTGSATIAAIPSGCAITGNVNVQRYVTNHRAYRLVSSPVYTSTVGTDNVYSLDYIKNSAYVTGTTGAAGGFDKTGNPTLFLYRENLAPQYTTFLNSNFRGINNISSSPNYLMDIDNGPFNIPAGNGFLFYYRGSRRQMSLAGATTPGAAATTDTLTATGTLNQGTITVSNWYTPTSPNLLWTTAAGDPAIEGFNLVGNPYPSSIDWDQYSASNSSAGIYAPSVAPFSYQLIPTGAQGSGNYGVYQANTSGAGTNGATNIIATGVGFFVQANDASAQLIFSETAKTNIQAVTGADLFMGKPIASGKNNRYLRLQMAKDSINSDESLIRFDKQSTTLFDAANDARYKSGLGQVSLATLSADNVAMAIDRVPLPKNNKTLAIPLKIGANNNGSYSLNLKEINQVPLLYDIWLKDAFNKDSVNMRSSPMYAFTMSKVDTNTYGARRFTLVIRENHDHACRLLSFNGQKVSHKLQVDLSWKTLNEYNYTNFTVERSTDNGKTFDVIGGLASSGSGTYGLIDQNPAFGDNIYRLKQEDVDNNITYSNTVTIDIVNSDNKIVCIYPNPARNVINLCINAKSPATDTFNIRISSSTGLVIRNILAAHSDWEDNISDLLTGTYLVRVINNKDNSLVGETKFVKL